MKQKFLLVQKSRLSALDDMWEHATNALKRACERHNLAYEINEGDGAFHGPKIDIKVKDAIGRTWQCSTVQVDFNLPERFELTYRTAEQDPRNVLGCCTVQSLAQSSVSSAF